MTAALLASVDGSYRFLPGIDPYSSGVVAAPGFEVVHATLRAPVPWRDGFTRIEAHLREHGRPRTALCAIALRIPAPLSFDGFASFNRGYRELLAEWGLLAGGQNPIARTNVAPVVGAPPAASLHAFAYTRPAAPPGPTFVVAGSGELRDRSMDAAGIVRGGDTSPAAMREKAEYVVGVMRDRLRGLGADWPHVTAVDVYTAYPIHGFLAGTVLAALGPAAVHGVRWYLSRPPIAGLDYEMDMRGVGTDLVL
jgi:hypothetical protein